MKSIYVLLFILLILSVAYLGYDKYNTGIKLKKSIQKNEDDFKDLNDIFLGLADLSLHIPYNTVADDEITIPPLGAKFLPFGCRIPSYKKYSINFEVTQIDSLLFLDTNKQNIHLRLNNVENAIYAVFYNESQNKFSVPEFDYDSYYIRENINKFKPNQIFSDKKNNKWTFISYRELNLDKKALFETARKYNTGMNTIPYYPTQLQCSLGPDIDLKPLYASETITNFDSILYYDHAKTIKFNKTRIDKRIFNIIFQAPYKVGWFKLRIYSRSNRILSISNEWKDPPRFELNSFFLNENLLNWYIDSLYSKIKKYNVPDYKKVAVTPHDNSYLDSFYVKLKYAMLKANLSDNSREFKYLKSYKELVRYVLPNMNKFVDSRGFIDYNIFVKFPENWKSVE